MQNATPHPDDLGRWRDLSDQLTPEQIAELEDAERDYRTRDVA